MLSKIGSVAVTVYTWVVWLLGFVVNAVKAVVILGDKLSEAAFLLVGTAITVASAIMVGGFVIKCYLATPLVIHLIALGVLALVVRGAFITWRMLKDIELDQAIYLLEAHLLSGVILAWEGIKWIFSKKESE